jgi:hypothetical protein
MLAPWCAVSLVCCATSCSRSDVADLDANSAGAPDGGAGRSDAADGGGGSSGAAPLHILFIGNSYTYVNDLPGMLTSIAATSGSPPTITTDEVVQGGAALEDHWNNGIAQTKIAQGSWTHVVLQDQSGDPLALPGPPSTFPTYAKQFSDLILLAGAKPTFFATWARAPGDPIYSPLPFGEFACPAEMQDELTIAYATAAKAEPQSVLTCVGEAFKRAIAQHPEIVLQQSDFSHPTVAGTYLAASTFYVALTGNPVPNASAVPAGLSAIDAATLRDIARVGTDCSDVTLKGAISTNFPFAAGGGEAPFEFGTSGEPITTQFQLTNTGGAVVGIHDGMSLAPPFQWTAGGAYPGGSDPSFCADTLSPGNTCTISVTYSGASSATGSVTLDFTGDTYLPSATCVLHGTATDRAFLSVSDNPGLFGCTDANCAPSSVYSSPGGTGTLDLFVMNRGALPVTSIAEGISLGAPFAWAGGAFPGGVGSVTTGVPLADYPYCTGALGVGEQCVVSITFSTDTLGTYAGAVNLAYADALGPAASNANRNIAGTCSRPLPP